MAGDTYVTVIGNLTGDPELRFTPSGAAVSNFTVASTPRSFDKQTNEWKDGDPMFLGGSVWREYAENVAETLTKGTRVIVYGKLKARPYQTKEGENRTAWEIDVEEIGPSLRYATAKITRRTRNDNGGGQQGGGNQGGWNQPAQSGNNQDPWGGGGGQPAPQASGAPNTNDWGAPAQDPPF